MNHYYKNYKLVVSRQERPELLSKGYTQITVEQYIAKRSAIKNIEKLKQQLADTDYKYFKYVDGELTKAEWEAIQTERKGWRAQINQLEQLLDA